MMKDLVVRSFVGAACLLMVTATAEAQKGGPIGRVAGIAITNLVETPSGGGSTVDFDVRLATSTVSSLQRLVSRASFSFTPTSSYIQSQYGGQLGDAHQGSAGIYRGSYQFGTTQTFYDGTYRGPGYPATLAFYVATSGTVTEVSRTLAFALDGEIPGIDFGDGATRQFVQLSSITDTSTQTGSTTGRQRTFRFWRGSFSHSYAGPGPFDLRVASRCCGVNPDPPSPGRGLPNPYTTITAGNLVYAQSPSELDYRVGSTYRTVFRNANVVSSYNTTFTPTAGPRGAGGRTGTFTLRYPLDSEPLPSDASVNQVTAAVAGLGGGGVNVLEIPTAGSWALGLLALGLAGLGVILLRRS